MEKNSIFLSSSFYAMAQLKSDMLLVKQRLGGLSHARKLSDEPILKYEIFNGEFDKEASLLELADDHISLRHFFKKQSANLYKNNLLSFISIIAFLGDLYEVKLESIYSYIIEALGQNWQGTVKDQNQIISVLKERINALDESNCHLSRRLIQFSYENKISAASLLSYREFSKEILDKFRYLEDGPSKKEYNALTHLGIDLGLIQKVENDLANYRMRSP